MHIAAAHLHSYVLPLRTEWNSASGNLKQREGWLLQLESDDGRSGWGECAPLPSHGSEDHPRACVALNRWQKALPGQALEDALTALLTPESFYTPAARTAIECALLDLQAQHLGLPLFRHLKQARGSREIHINTILGDVIGASHAMLADAIAAGFTVIKLKLGLAPPAAELTALHRLAASLPTGVTLRLDANRAWDAKTATHFLHSIVDLPIESVEEPLNIAELAVLRRLQGELPYPLALDESISGLDHQKLFGDAPVRRLVLKLAPTGGMLPALALARRAAAAGMECVVTTGIDSACGTLAAAHLASAIDNPLQRLAHGLATAHWLTADTGPAMTIRKGIFRLADSTGLGFTRMRTD